MVFATSNGTATAGSDDTAVNTIVRFLPGQTSATVGVPITNDSLPEPNETVNLTLSSPDAGAVLGSPTSAVLTIVDNDGATIRFSASAYSVNEATSNATITVSRSGGLERTNTVNFATSDGTASASSDYTAVNTVVRFLPGQSSVSVLVPINNDPDPEPNETVKLALSNPDTGAVLGSPSNAVLTIVDNDAATIRFSSSAYSVTESSPTGAVFVTRTGGLETPNTVQFTTSGGTATVGLDYQSVSRMVTFLPGQSSISVGIPILNDTLVETNETVNLTLSNPGPGAMLGSPSNAVLTIVDNDTATIRFSTPAYSVNEATSNAVITVTRSGGLELTNMVDYATSDGTAQAGMDYTAVSGTPTFLPSQTSRTFSVPITNDMLTETNETVNLMLNSPGPGAVLGVPGAAVLTIIDND